MKSNRKAPTPEREGLVLQAKEEGKAVGFVQKEHIKVHGQLCNASKKRLWSVNYSQVVREQVTSRHECEDRELLVKS